MPIHSLRYRRHAPLRILQTRMVLLNIPRIHLVPILILPLLRIEHFLIEIPVHPQMHTQHYRVILFFSPSLTSIRRIDQIPAHFMHQSHQIVVYLHSPDHNVFHSLKRKRTRKHEVILPLTAVIFHLPHCWIGASVLFSHRRKETPETIS